MTCIHLLFSLVGVLDPVRLLAVVEGEDGVGPLPPGAPVRR